VTHLGRGQQTYNSLHSNRLPHCKHSFAALQAACCCCAPAGGVNMLWGLLLKVCGVTAALLLPASSWSAQPEPGLTWSIASRVVTTHDHARHTISHPRCSDQRARLSFVVCDRRSSRGVDVWSTTTTVTKGLAGFLAALTTTCPPGPHDTFS